MPLNLPERSNPNPTIMTHTARPIELLAPARDAAVGREAILHGADAVYIGGPEHGARAAAGNTVDDIAGLCAFAHTYYAKVYVTLNTILLDDELERAGQLIRDLYDAGVDALITQDAGLPDMAGLPPIALHASTQMDNRTAADVALRRDEGFTRVVLARECPLEQIRQIHEAVPGVDLEAFVHGALCVSYSGRCYASAYKFGRSANRGQCAQFCRLAFDLVDARGNVLANNAHLLSLKDMCRIGDIEAMMDAGVSSFKIEGRLKDAGYVKNVTAAYRQAIDSILERRGGEYRRSSAGRHTYSFTPDVGKSFNRGFTDYFLHDGAERCTTDVHQFATPKAMGESIGTVAAADRRGITIDYDTPGTTRVVAGDGLCYLHATTGRLVGLRVNRVGDDGRIIPAGPAEGLRPGTRISRNHDQTMDRLLARQSATRRIPLRLTLRETPQGYSLAAVETEGGTPASAVHEVAAPHETAHGPQRENTVRALSKLGDTPFEADGVEILTEGERFVPASLLSAMRRDVTEKLLREKAASYRRERPGHAQPEAARAGTEDRAPVTYTYNVANRLAVAHWNRMGRQVGEMAFELVRPTQATLMTCRHCIRRATGHCPKANGPQPAPWNGPLYLRTTDGERFPLAFDCRRCEMRVEMPANPARPTARRERGKGGGRLKSLMPVLWMVMATLLTLGSCTYRHSGDDDHWTSASGVEPDSTEFRVKHHYWKNDFFMATDTLALSEYPHTEMAGLPVIEAEGGASVVATGEEVGVVGLLLTHNRNGNKQIWVQVARDRFCKGWIEEDKLLENSIPARPISKFIYYFSNRSLAYFGSVLLLSVLILMIRLAHRRRIPFVHFNDIRSFYPTLLCLTVATEATIYGTMQRFAPDTWVEYYFHPTLNPFSPHLPLILMLFVGMLWLTLLVGIATIEDLRHAPEDFGIIAYCAGLAMMCVALYLVFSLSVHIYVGYPLLLAYWIFAFVRHHRFATPHYRCGNCGAPIEGSGKCEECGMENKVNG